MTAKSAASAVSATGTARARGPSSLATIFSEEGRLDVLVHNAGIHETRSPPSRSPRPGASAQRRQPACPSRTWPPSRASHLLVDVGVPAEQAPGGIGQCRDGVHLAVGELEAEEIEVLTLTLAAGRLGDRQ